MKRLGRWLSRRAAEERRRTSLDAALLTGRAWRYAVYRVRFLFLRAVLRAMLFLAEVILFSMLFSLDFLAPIIVVRSATAVAGGLWWGFLEALREDVRDHASGRRWGSVRAAIDSWLVLAGLLAAVVVGGGTAWVFGTPDPTLGFSIFDTYALGCFLRLGCDMVTRTYHSGVFAIRRIARPLWSLLIPDLADLLVVLALWPFLGPWGFGISIGAVGILRAVLTAVYVRRAFRRSRIPRLEAAGLLRRFRRLPFRRLPAGLVHALANGAGHLDAFLIIALVAASESNEEYLALAILFHLVRPFLAAGFGWARVFYFDFKKLQRRYGLFFMRRFQAFVRRAGAAFSLLLSGLSLAWAWVFWPGPFDPAWLLLIPFFLGRSLLGIDQVQAFSYGRHLYLAAQGAVLGAVILALAILPLDAVQVLSLSGLSLLLAVLVLGPPEPSPLPREPAAGAPLFSLPRWLSALARERGPVRVGALLVDTALESGPRATRGLAAALSPDEPVTRFGHAQLLWFEPAGGKPRPLSGIVTAVAGAAREVGTTGPHPDGRTAWREAEDRGILERPLLDLLHPATPPPRDRAGLAAEFARRFPDGVVLDERRGSIPPRRYPLSAYQVRRLLDDVFRKSSGLSPRRCAIPELDLTVYCPGGQPALLFVVRSAHPAADRAAWRRLVDSATLAHSL